MFRYPNRLAHRTPAWVESAATYHICVSVELNCIRLERVRRPRSTLTEVVRKVEPGLWTGSMTPVQEYPSRPSHTTPGWVNRGAIYHVRIRTEPSSPIPLTNPKLATALLDSARLYHSSARWHCCLFLLMPDHLHALLAFPPDKKMSDIIGIWQGFQAKQHGIHWQGNYFDHRIRSKVELKLKAVYIRLNPVVKKLCVSESDWPWVISDVE